MKNLKTLQIWFKINQQGINFGALMFCILPFVSACITLTDQAAADKSVKTIFTGSVAEDQIVPAADFNILGRISIQNQDQRFSGSFRWQHLASSDEILLFTPLGQAVAEVAKGDDGVRLITSKLEAFYANDVESLTQEVLGWRLPLDGLQYWIQGTHSPATAAQKDLDNKDQVIAIRQDGWKIHYGSYMVPQKNQIPLPKTLDLVYENLRIRLVVDDWKVE